MPVPPGDLVEMANDRGLQGAGRTGEDATPLQFVGTIHDWVNGMRNNHGANTLSNTEWDRFVDDRGGEEQRGFRREEMRAVELPT
jgi:hypothetical protein